MDPLNQNNMLNFALKPKKNHGHLNVYVSMEGSWLLSADCWEIPFLKSVKKNLQMIEIENGSTRIRDVLNDRR